MGCSANAAASRAAAAAAASAAAALPAGGTAAVGYSGGLDSTVLLGALRLRLPPKIRLLAVHVNHRLQPQSAAWVRHCRRRCRLWQVPLQVVEAKFDPRPAGLEERARKARFAALASVRADAVLLAHHADDQAETCLLRALRGSGVTGLAAMRAASMLPGTSRPLLRPLLGLRKAELGLAARALKVRGVRDPSNDRLLCNRNWLRHAVLPQAAVRMPGPVAALNKLAANALQTEQLLDELARMDDANCRIGGVLQRPALAACGRLRVRNWLRWSLRERQVVLGSGAQLSEAARQLCASSGRLALAFGSAKLIVGRRSLNWQRPH